MHGHIQLWEKGIGISWPALPLLWADGLSLLVIVTGIGFLVGRIADSEGPALEPVENPNIGDSGGARIQSAQLVANKGANLLITGQVGPNAYTTLQAAGIKIVTAVTGRVEDVLERWKKGDFSPFTQGPTVQAHKPLCPALR